MCNWLCWGWFTWKNADLDEWYLETVSNHVAVGSTQHRTAYGPRPPESDATVATNSTTAGLTAPRQPAARLQTTDRHRAVSETAATVLPKSRRCRNKHRACVASHSELKLSAALSGSGAMSTSLAYTWIARPKCASTDTARDSPSVSRRKYAPM